MRPLSKYLSKGGGIMGAYEKGEGHGWKRGEKESRRHDFFQIGRGVGKLARKNREPGE